MDGPNGTWAKGQVAECAVSLVLAIQEAGGRCSEQMLDMTLREFIANVAGQNGIRFVYKKPKEC